MVLLLNIFLGVFANWIIAISAMSGNPKIFCPNRKLQSTDLDGDLAQVLPLVLEYEANRMQIPPVYARTFPHDNFMIYWCNLSDKESNAMKVAAYWVAKKAIDGMCGKNMAGQATYPVDGKMALIIGRDDYADGYPKLCGEA